MIQILEPKIIYFETDGGTKVDNQKLYKGQKVSKPANPTRNGDKFEGWHDGSGREWDFDTVPTGDLTLFAKWILQFTVMFDSSGGTDVDAKTVTEGGYLAQPPDPAKTNAYKCKFGGWYKDPDFANAWNFKNDTVTSDITLYAKWEAYAVGDRGPGSGIIFYRAPASFTVQGYTGAAGSFASYTAYYLEAAPFGLGEHEWASPEWESKTIPGMVEYGQDSDDAVIGAGRKNTALILASDTAAPAALACRNAAYGGKTDWFLPSLDELAQLRIQKTYIGNPTNTFISSTQNSSTDGCCCNFNSNNPGSTLKKWAWFVWAVRAF